MGLLRVLGISDGLLDDAGHASMVTTDRYIDSDLRERHASGKKKRIKEIY